MKLKMIKKLLPYFIKKPIKKLYLYFLFIIDFKKFKKASRGDRRFEIKWEYKQSELEDNTSATSFDAHYLYHPAWAARVLAEIKPKKHVDISSILNFSTIISAFIPVEFYDYRPVNVKLNNFHAGKADLLSLPFLNNSVESLSCMHTIEHIGLGRYGDSINPRGDIRAIEELKRVVAKNGNLIFVAPIGKPKTMFNAHRIYSYNQIISYFDGFELKKFSLIPDNARQVGMIKNADKKTADIQKYGCGCFWFKKVTLTT
ncbi:MAG: hypothetical protein C0412_18155 [Flavobacterium sp.]|nr:hypothetical protein [Flavobacterium sp.]